MSIYIRPRVKRDMEFAASVFNRIVRPVLEDRLHWQFFSIEGSAEEGINYILDVTCGIDIWAYRQDVAVRGIANRIQPYGKNYQTFTIRYRRESGQPTEYAKRIEAIERGYLYPHWTLQAYTDKAGDELLGFAVVKTVDLLQIIKNGCCFSRRARSDNHGWADFYCVNWHDLKAMGTSVFIHSPSLPAMHNGQQAALSLF